VRLNATKVLFAASRALHARERLVAVGVDLSRAQSRWHGRLPRQTSQRLIDVEHHAGFDVADFWEPMHSRKEPNLILDPGEFYILASKEAVQVLPDYPAEMVPFDPLVGDTMPALWLRGRRREIKDRKTTEARLSPRRKVPLCVSQRPRVVSGRASMRSDDLQAAWQVIAR